MTITLLKSSFDGGTDGVAITTGNSGGASGNAFDAVNSAGGVTAPTFRSTQRHGSSGLAFGVTQGATNTFVGGSTVQWNFASEPAIYVRFYVWLPPTPGWLGNTLYVCRPCGLYLYMSSSGAGWLDSTGSGMSGIGDVNIGITNYILGRWVRVEAYANSVTQQNQAKIFVSAIESDNPTMDSGLGNTGRSMSAMTNFIFGCVGGTNVQPGPYSNSTVYFDDIAVSTVGWIGPSGAVDRDLHVNGLRDRLATSGSKRVAGGVARSVADYPLLARRAWITPPPRNPPASGGGISIIRKP